MKNRHANILITCVFAAFTLGFLLGRTSAPGDTIVARIPHESLPAASQPETAANPVTSSPFFEISEISVAASSPAEATDASVAASAPAETNAPDATESGLININTATLAQLDSLPGIGPVLAQRILDYREQHGPFTSVNQLTLVEGIGEKRLAAIIDLITIE